MIILRLLTLIIYTIPCFFGDRVQKDNCYLSVRILTSRKFSGGLFVVWLSLNIFFQPFCDIFTWNCMNHGYLVAVSTVNTENRSNFVSLSLLKTQYLPFILALGIEKISPIFFLSSKPLKYFRQHDVLSFLLLNTLFWLFSKVQLVIAWVSPSDLFVTFFSSGFGFLKREIHILYLAFLLTRPKERIVTFL